MPESHQTSTCPTRMPRSSPSDGVQENQRTQLALEFAAAIGWAALRTRRRLR